MTLVFRDRAHCLRSRPESFPGNLTACCRESCDRYVTDGVIEAAKKKGLPIDWHDLKTGICGFVPREGD